VSTSSPTIVDSFGTLVEVLNYLWNKHSQKLVDNDLTWKFLPDRGHVEFYQFGPTLAAVPIYDTNTNERLELVIVGALMPVSRVDLAVNEMVNMIRRKRIGPVPRRIKFLDNDGQ
jgi:hypothetical protein